MGRVLEHLHMVDHGGDYAERAHQAPVACRRCAAVSAAPARGIRVCSWTPQTADRL